MRPGWGRARQWHWGGVRPLPTSWLQGHLEPHELCLPPAGPHGQREGLCWERESFGAGGVSQPLTRPGGQRPGRGDAKHSCHPQLTQGPGSVTLDPSQRTLGKLFTTP